ncbi:BZ3500_MvSof-1268-A1-R1_Chr4-3g07241 [Microbotryum saponariae]|uniref:BZ3500_MvSof-1268-A1-R1_Chr4-3g07241 protein n=1 Tax=Microbotryum saponariae TaxID=289078 RepID=A0A2X0MYZ0_9BASI|nr:BZ3500_MvSof-1268-A1-R1_Chr4-3g07241 [Microbotryum saponariae]SDA06904.1 BZ3501_MvSof-1269-A2-R1_Chr4-2g06950 [Microbotryum saponariae]
MAKLFSRLGRTRPSDAPIATIKPTECDVSDKAEGADKSKDGSLDEPADDGPALHPHVQVNAAFVDLADLDPEFLDKNGKEAIDLGLGTDNRVIETAHDFSTRLISLEDDPSLPVHTIRMWTIGLGLTCFGAVLGQIFTFRPQEYEVSALFLQIFAYVLGTGWYKVLPKPSKGRFWEILNPGPFNIKEHVCITVMASTGSNGALAISTFAAEKLFYNIDLNYGVAIFTLIGEWLSAAIGPSSAQYSPIGYCAASQFFGYGLGGLFRSILVYPTFAVWPSLIPSVSLIETLHREPDLASQKKRYRFFWIGFVAIFVWEWFPEIIAPTLTGISVFCLANRTSPNFTRLFGGSNGNEGLGLFSIGLDWLQITSLPLYMPWATTVSKGLGVVLCIVVSIAGYFGNAWNAKNYPFLGQNLFYENGTRYHQNLILDAHFNLNKTALAEQGESS